MTDASPRFRRAHIVAAALVTALATLGSGQIASAHTDFDSSTPAESAVVDGPLTEVVVNFTNPAVIAGEGFELLDPTGAVRAPSSVDETDGTSFVLTFEPPLEAGSYGVRWKVQAGDAHPIDGAFRFEVTATSSPTTTVSGASATAAAPPTTVATGMSMDGMEVGDTAHATMTDETMDDFLNAGSMSHDSAALGRVGRTISILGAIFGIGVLAALVWTIRGRHEELDTQLAWIRLAGLAMFTGGFIEYAALTDIDPAASLDALLTTKPGAATALKMVGGLAVMFGFHGRAGRIVAPPLSLSAAVATELRPENLPTAAETAHHDHGHGHGEHRWTPTSSAALGLVGYALVLISFWFDGHTVSKGPWAVHSVVNFIHLGAAAVWGGGVFAMTTVAWMRRCRSERVGLAAMVVRFSSIATVSLAAVIVAGLVMTVMILDTPGDLFGTQWGRILVAKIAVVAVAAGLGGYNHFRLRPELEQRPDDPALAKELRVSLAIESAVFIAIVVLTAILVASAT